MVEDVPERIGEAIDAAIDEVTGLPPAGRITRFEADGSTVVVEERGVPGPVHLLVHGLGMGRRVFGDLVRILQDSGRVVAIDLPGYGDAPEPPRTPTIGRSADLVAALVRARGFAPVVLIGHSMGSQVAIELAARHPDLVDRLVLVAPSVDHRRRHPLQQVVRLAVDIVLEKPRVILLGAREYLRAGPHVRRKLPVMLAHRPEDTAPRVRTPTLILRGERDIVSPREWCRHLLSRLPDGRLVELPDRRHETLIHEADPAAAAIAAFLAEA